MQESPSIDRISSGLELSATHRTVVALVLVLVLVMSLGVVLHDYLFIALNAACVFVLTIPWWGQKRVNWFSIWSVLTLSAVINLLLRSAYITFDIPNHYDIENLFLLGRSKEFLLPVMPIMLAGLATLTAGYLVGPRASASIPLRVYHLDRWHDRRLLVLVCVMLLVSVVAFVLFIQHTGGFDPQRISAKRTAARGLELEDYQAYGYLLWMTDLSTLAGLLLLVRAMSNEPQARRYLLLLLPALAISVSFHVYASSRAGVVFPLFQALALAYYLSGRLLKLRGLVILGIIGLMGFGWLTQLRQEGELTHFLPAGLNMLRWLDPFVVTQPSVDASKTAHILDAIPEVFDYQLGRTLVVWMVAWIPRSLWPAKPVISVACFMMLGMTLVGGSISKNMVEFLKTFVPLYAILYFLTEHQSPVRTAEAGREP